MSVTVNGSTGLTFNDGTSQSTSAFYGGLALRNRIINGAMVIDQRNAGASVSTSSGIQTYTVDRWKVWYSATSKYTVQQNAGSVTPPTGFKNYLGVTSSAATSSGSTDYYFISQPIEGFNTADLGFGTASASAVTLSFWVRSSLTGTFGGSLQNSAGNRSYPFSFTISSANTWEQKSVTIAGDTSGTWLTDNSTGILVNFNLGVGSSRQSTVNTWGAGDYQAPTGATSVVGTNGATFYITGVQLEKGSTATSFDYRPYGTELALCQRYFQRTSGYNLTASSNGAATGSYTYIVEMRAAPTLSVSAAIAISDGGTDYTQSPANVSIGGGSRITNRAVQISHSNFSGLTTYRPLVVMPNVGGETLFSAEL